MTALNELSHEGMPVPAEAGALREASFWIRSECLAQGVPEEQTDRLELCFNEAAANVIAHGGPSALDSDMRVQLRVTSDAASHEAEIVMTDSGQPFNPVDSPLEKRPGRLEDAEPGGLGLLMLHSFSDRMSYRRAGERNELRFSVTWSDKFL